MKQHTITKFTGLHVAENTTTVPDGALERANNVVISQDNLLQKRRGLIAWHTFPASQAINTLFSYESSIFVLSQNKLYKFNNNVTSATCTWTGSSKTIAIASATHGIASNDFISGFYIDPASTKMSLWGNRQVDFYGTRAVTSTGAGTFTIQADNEALTTNAVPVPCYYRKYTQVSGVTVSISDSSRIAYSNGNAYFTTDNGVIKLEDENASTIEAGIPPALDIISITLGQTSDSKNTGFLKPATVKDSFYQVAYRVLFGRKDANNNFVLGAPGAFLSVSNNVLYLSTTATSAVTTVTVTTAVAHGLATNDIIYLYEVIGATVTPAVGTLATVTLDGVSPTTKFSFTLASAGAAVSSVTWQLAKCAKVKFTIPSEILSTDYFYRVYRTSQGTDTNIDYQLIEEKNLNATNISNKYVEYQDEVYDQLLTKAYLYTNSNQEGDLQANDRPPNCKDLALFKTNLFYANCKQYPILSLSLLSADKIADNTYLNLAGKVYKLSTAAGAGEIKLVYSSGSVTISQAIDSTARNIIAVVNADVTSPLYASYISGINDVPGKMQFIAKNFISDYYIYGSNAATCSAFTPNPTFSATINTPTLTATDTKSDTSDFPNGLYISKPSEPEAVPLTNFLAIGSRDKSIIRIAALRDSLIILKEDGVYRLNGSTVNDYSATLLDGTVICKSANSLAILNNSVYCLSNQGVVQITDSSVRVISRPIEPLISAIIGDPALPTTSAGVAYESERTYLLSCKSPNTNLTIADNTYVYHYLSDGITTASDGGSVFKTALLNNKEDKLYTIEASNTSLLYRERKDQKKTDFLGEEFVVQVDASIICNAYAIVNSNQIKLTSKVKHGLLLGSRITVSKVTSDLYSLFTGGTADVSGLRIVSQIVDEYTFCFTADTNSTSSISSTMSYQNNVSEYEAIAVTSNGSAVVTVNTTNSHGFINAQTIKIDAYTTTTLGNIKGPVAITYISPTSFSFKITGLASGTETKTITISDNMRNYNYLTLTTPNNIQPQAGDGLVNGADLYPIDEITLFGLNKFIAYTPAKYTGLSTDLVFLGSGIRSILRFTSITLEQPGELKYYSEFAATFKNNSSFTKATINFANDFTYSTVNTEWNLKVGSDKSLISFGGWGQLEWGEFAWGGEYSTNREFLTRPAVVLRTYVPKDVFVGTFIQPIIYHNKAGEAIDLQSISVFSMPVTTRISR